MTASNAHYLPRPNVHQSPAGAHGFLGVDQDGGRVLAFGRRVVTFQSPTSATRVSSALQTLADYHLLTPAVIAAISEAGEG